MKILIIVNHPDPQAKHWWFPYLKPCAKAQGISMDVENVSDKIGIKTLLNLRRHIHLLRKSRSYDWVVTFQDGFSTFWFGILRRLFNLKKPRHAVLEFITREKAASIYDRLKYTFIGFSLKNSRLFCSSRSEALYFQQHIGFTDQQTVYVPLAGEPCWLNEIPDRVDNYILSAGRTLRDYKTLLSAIEGLSVPLIIVTSPRCIADLNIPNNVKLVFDIPQQQLLDMMKRAKFIVLPLEEKVISCGQRVLLMAMALGKACIVTRISGTVDYIQDGENGIFVEPYDPEMLRAKINELWETKDQLTKIGENARKTYESTHMIEQYAKTVLSHLK